MNRNGTALRHGNMFYCAKWKHWLKWKIITPSTLFPRENDSGIFALIISTKIITIKSEEFNATEDLNSFLIYLHKVPKI